MEKTYILGSNKALLEIGGVFQTLPTNLNTNEENTIHDWIVHLLKKNDIEKIIIEIGENPQLALQIGYHIRLSIEELKQKSLIPILFVSTFSLNTVLIKSDLYSQILATKGVSFCEFDLDIIKAEITHLEGLTENDYSTGFLRIIHIQPDETIGRHSLANIWGAYTMERSANTNALSADIEFKKTLYFKYISAFNNLDKLKPSSLKIVDKIVLGNANHIKSDGKRILLIDDEADKGWETVLRSVFNIKNHEDFVVIKERVKDYEAFSEKSKKIIETEMFDLYLIDLRLNGLKEEGILNTKDFSGMKVLKKIKSINEGNQVIIFTASNKTWNLKSLLDAGADGYYMKESPEYHFSSKISEQNYLEFKENVINCFDRGYLRDVFTHWEKAKSKKTNPNEKFIQESTTALEVAWELIKKGFLDFGFLTLFQFIEYCANKLFKYDENLDIYTMNDTPVIEKYNNGYKKWRLTFNKDNIDGDYFSEEDSIQKDTQQPTTLYKVSCLLYLIYEKPNAFLQYFGKLNKLRNDIVHPGKRKTDKNDLIELIKIIENIRTK